tara:strand:- start:154 stop:414 length:261 start_codon:yes stop_codon:yes gene_type:complete
MGAAVVRLEGFAEDARAEKVTIVEGREGWKIAVDATDMGNGILIDEALGLDLYLRHENDTPDEKRVGLDSGHHTSMSEVCLWKGRR